MEPQPSNSVGPWYTTSSQEPPPAYNAEQGQHKPNNVQYQQPPSDQSGGCCSCKSICGTLMAIVSALFLLGGLGMGLYQLAQFIKERTKGNSTPILYPAVAGIYYNNSKGCENRFECKNGAGCISYAWQCDGINDCYDNSDESECSCKTASEKYCSGGGCYSTSKICDGYRNCKNSNDDEQYCFSSCPSSTHFQCKSNRRCVPLKLRCDGKDDCGDLSDEIGCTCSSTETACACGLCVKLDKWCDGLKDCRDGSDELAGCHKSCPKNGVRCAATGICMNQAQICDRIIDCVGGSDEISCTGCPADQFKCSNGYCIPNAWLCDGISDCTTGEDEAQPSCTKCSSSEFQCMYETKKCIPVSQRCDGTINCADNSDEKTCVKLSGTGSGPNSLLVYQSGTTESFVCLENWNQTWSDFACRQMGLGGSKSSSGIAVTPRARLLRTSPNKIPSTGSLVQYLESTSSCSSNQMVQLECEPLGCGTRAVPQQSVGPYLVNGAPAARGAWPWQVRILYDSNILCGGSILNEQWILTAAHCVVDYKDPSKIEVRAGSVKFEGADPDAQVRSVRGVYKHQSYDDNNQRNVLVHDVALLRLSTPLAYTDTVRRICLPSSSVNLNQFKLCVSTGFGRTRSDGSSSKVLLQGRMEPMSQDLCRKAFSDLSSGSSWQAASSDFDYMVCAGSYPAPAGIDICQGDSGGPLACQDQEGAWSVIGVSSFGFSNCDLSVFARVPAYSQWIVNTISSIG